LGVSLQRNRPQVTAHRRRCFRDSLSDVGHESEEPGAFYRTLSRSLMFSAVSASLSREHFALVGREFSQGSNVLVIHFSDLVTAEAAFCLLVESLLLLRLGAPCGKLPFSSHRIYYLVLVRVTVLLSDRLSRGAKCSATTVRCQNGISSPPISAGGGAGSSL
jgi:hypothetical protein